MQQAMPVQKGHQVVEVRHVSDVVVATSPSVFSFPRLRIQKPAPKTVKATSKHVLRMTDEDRARWVLLAAHSWPALMAPVMEKVGEEMKSRSRKRNKAAKTFNKYRAIFVSYMDSPLNRVRKLCIKSVKAIDAIVPMLYHRRLSNLTSHAARIATLQRKLLLDLKLVTDGGR